MQTNTNKQSNLNSSSSIDSIVSLADALMRSFCWKRRRRRMIKWPFIDMIPFPRHLTAALRLCFGRSTWQMRMPIRWWWHPEFHFIIETCYCSPSAGLNSQRHPHLILLLNAPSTNLHWQSTTLLLINLRFKSMLRVPKESEKKKGICSSLSLDRLRSTLAPQQRWRVFSANNRLMLLTFRHQMFIRYKWRKKERRGKERAPGLDKKVCPTLP